MAGTLFFSLLSIHHLEQCLESFLFSVNICWKNVLKHKRIHQTQYHILRISDFVEKAYFTLLSFKKQDTQYNFHFLFKKMLSICMCVFIHPFLERKLERLLCVHSMLDILSHLQFHEKIDTEKIVNECHLSSCTALQLCWSFNSLTNLFCTGYIILCWIFLSLCTVNSVRLGTMILFNY